MQRELSFFLKTAAGGLLVAAVLSISIYATRDLSRGAELTLSYPTDRLSVKNALIEVVGNVSNANSVTLDDRKIFVTEAGDFKEKLLLLPGYNIMTITVEDRFNRKKIKRVEVVLDDRTQSFPID
jgi:hypothetical protein